MSPFTAAGIGEDRRGPLFRSCEPGRRDALQDRAMSRLSALKMIKRRARKSGLPAEICAHSFRGTGITEYLRNGGDLEVAARIAGHESTRTTQLYNRLSRSTRSSASTSERSGACDALLERLAPVNRKAGDETAPTLAGKRPIRPDPVVIDGVDQDRRWTGCSRRSRSTRSSASTSERSGACDALLERLAPVNRKAGDETAPTLAGKRPIRPDPVVIDGVDQDRRWIGSAVFRRRGAGWRPRRSPRRRRGSRPHSARATIGR